MVRWQRLVPGVLGPALLLMACNGASLPSGGPSLATTAASGASSTHGLQGTEPTRLNLMWSATDGLGRPTGVAIGPDGTIFVVSFDTGQINRFTAEGSKLPSWSGPGTGRGQLKSALGIAVDAGGNVYVADYGNARIQKFSATGDPLATWGVLGDGAGEFDGPSDVAISPDGLIYVSEDRNHRVQVFTNDGRWVRTIESAGDTAFGDPTGVAFADGHVYIGDYGQDSIFVLGLDGAFVSSFGGTGSGDGQFHGISYLAVASDGRLLVTDYDNGRIQAFDPDGTFLESFVLSDGSEFADPYGIAMTPNNQLVISEFSAKRLDSFKLGPRQN